MEVASPLAFAPATAGSKRSLGACSPQMIDHGSLSEMEVADESVQRSAKRRRFHAETAIDSLSDRLSSHSPFVGSSIFSGTPAAAPSSKRSRVDSPTSNPVQGDVSRVLEEQAALIDSLKKEKTGLESDLSSLKSDHERVVKENQILRKAVTIQKERQNQAENELKAAHKYRDDAEEKMKKLEQLVLSLRYHLQTQQQASLGNDFLHQRPPDVF